MEEKKKNNGCRHKKAQPRPRSLTLAEYGKHSLDIHDRRCRISSWLSRARVRSLSKVLVVFSVIFFFVFWACGGGVRRTKARCSEQTFVSKA